MFPKGNIFAPRVRGNTLRGTALNPLYSALRTILGQLRNPPNPEKHNASKGF
jgi:hypothetical protein